MARATLNRSSMLQTWESCGLRERAQMSAAAPTPKAQKLKRVKGLVFKFEGLGFRGPQKAPERRLQSLNSLFGNPNPYNYPRPYKPKTQDPRPKTQDPRPKTQDPRPKTQDPRPKTQDPRPKAQGPKTQDPRPQDPKTPRPQDPKTPNPRPYEPRPKTPRPKTL